MKARGAAPLDRFGVGRADGVEPLGRAQRPPMPRGSAMAGSRKRGRKGANDVPNERRVGSVLRGHRTAHVPVWVPRPTVLGQVCGYPETDFLPFRFWRL